MTKERDGSNDRDFVTVVSRMTHEERWRFFVRYVNRHGTALRKAARCREIVENVFASGKCPHCGGKLF